MINIIRTTIFADEEKEFRTFLETAGFRDFILSVCRSGIYLNIQFYKPATIMNYTLRGVETDYKVSHSNKYYYDLDQDWDDEANEFFGADDEI